jgi:hypothetical protein
LLQKIFDIIGIDDNNDTFSLQKIDNDLEKQQQILDLESEIKKYYYCSRWACFKTNTTAKRRWLSFIKYIVKSRDYNFISLHLRDRYVKKYSETLYKIYKD